MPEIHRPNHPRNPRDTTVSRGYGVYWHRLRKIKLARNPECEECGEIATQVDHVQTIVSGGRHVMSNLRSLCASCHSKKTVARDGGLGRERQ